MPVAVLDLAGGRTTGGNHDEQASSAGAAVVDHGVGDEALEAAGHDHMEVLAGLHHLRVEGLCFGKEEAACSMCQRTRCEADLRIVAERIVGEHEQGPVVHGTELAKEVVEIPPDPAKSTWNMSGNAAHPMRTCWTLMLHQGKQIVDAK